jgi:septation ring formation regulator EzrA
LRREMEEREAKKGKEVAGLKEEIDGLRKEVKEEKQHWGELVAAMKAKLAEAQDNIIKS